MKKTRVLIISLFLVILAASFSGCNSATAEKTAEPITDTIDTVDTPENEEHDGIDTDTPNTSENEEHDTIYTPFKSSGVLQNFMNEVYRVMDENNYGSLGLLPTWNENGLTGGNGVFFDTEDYSDVIWVTFYDENLVKITQDSESVKYSYITAYVLDENVDFLLKYLPFIIAADYPETSLDEAEEIVNFCLETGSLENDHASYYYDESDEFVDFYIILKDTQHPSDGQTQGSDLEKREIYQLDEIGITVEIPDKYFVATRDTKEDDFYAQLLDLDINELQASFEESDCYMTAVPIEYSVMHGIYIHVYDGSPWGDFKDMDESELSKALSVLKGYYSSMGVKVIKDEIYQHRQTPFVRLYVSSSSEIDTSEKIEYITFYGGKEYDILLQATPGEMEESLENDLQSIVDSISFISDIAFGENDETDTKESFVYVDDETGVSFTVPGNWRQGELHGEKKFLKVKFEALQDDTILIMYGGGDLWEQFSIKDMALYNVRAREDLNTEVFSEEDIKNLFELEEADVTLVHYSGKAYYKIKNTNVATVLGVEIKSTMFQLVRIENGYIYMFYFQGGEDDNDNEYFKDFEKLLENVQYPDIGTVKKKIS